MGLITKIFGSYSDRELKQIYPIVDKIEALEPEYKALTDQQLTAKTAEFKERLAQGETLDDILPEAFAAVREASVRVLGLRPYRVPVSYTHLSYRFVSSRLSTRKRRRASAKSLASI